MFDGYLHELGKTLAGEKIWVAARYGRSVVESETEATMRSQGDIANINQVSQMFVKGMLAKNCTAVAALYVDDAVLNPPHEPAVKGRTAINAWLEKFPPLTAFTLNNWT